MRKKGRILQRILLVIEIIALLCVMAAVSSACAPTEPKSILFLGDSIAEAIAGISPLTEHESYGYYGIIGNCNGYLYHNRGVSGYTTKNLLSFVKRSDDGINLVDSLLSTADIIHISILGNDFLLSDHTQMIEGLAKGDLTDIERRDAAARTNFAGIIETIRRKNPDATVILQTLYNPVGTDSPLFTPRARQTIARLGIEESEYHALMDTLIHRINAIPSDYLREHPNSFELADVYDAMEEVYRTDFDRWTRLFCGDGIHPSDEGHAIIAETIQGKLEELGLASSSALTRYKQDKCEQLTRLYADAPIEVGERIREAESFAAVNEIYFDGIEDLSPHYTETPTLTGEHFAETKRFKITLLKAFGSELTPLLRRYTSYIEFREDGSYELMIYAMSVLNDTLKKIIADNGGIDANDYYNVSLLLPYLHDIAPNAAFRDLRAILKEVETLYGISIVGIDYESESVAALFERFRLNGELVLDDPAVFDGILGLKCTGQYELREVTSPKTGEKYTAIYVNNATGRGESYVRYTYTVDEYGDETVRMTIDVLQGELEGELYAEE